MADCVICGAETENDKKHVAPICDRHTTKDLLKASQARNTFGEYRDKTSNGDE